MRKFFDEFAEVNFMDPLKASHWYSVTKKEIVDAGVCVSLHHNVCSDHSNRDKES
jgi:hypothetical protein